MTDPADLLARQLDVLRAAGVVSAELSPDGALLRVQLGPAPVELPRRSAPDQSPGKPQASPVPERQGSSVTVRPR